MLPVAIPDFVVGYAWHSIAPAVQGLAGATLVMTLGLYPLVYIPVAAALRRADRTEEEVARSLGLGPMADLRPGHPAPGPARPHRRMPGRVPGPAGRVRRLRDRALPHLHHHHLRRAECRRPGRRVGPVDRAGAHRPGRPRRRGGREHPGPAQPGRRAGGPGAGPAPAARTAAGWRPCWAWRRWWRLRLGVPVGTLVYWMQASHATTLPGASLWAALPTPPPTAPPPPWSPPRWRCPWRCSSVRFRSPASVVLERSTFLVQSLPGLVIALALVYFGTHYAHRFYQTAAMLVVAYAILFFPLALICVRASVAQAPRRLEEVARSLGQPPRIGAPAGDPPSGGGRAWLAGFCLVFLSAATELTATLLLVPTGVHTLATQFWAYQNDASYGAAAPYAVVMVALAAVPELPAHPLVRPSPGGGPGVNPLLERSTDRRPPALRPPAGPRRGGPGGGAGVVYGGAGRVGEWKDHAPAGDRRLRADRVGCGAAGDHRVRRRPHLTVRPSGAGSATCHRMGLFFPICEWPPTWASGSPRSRPEDRSGPCSTPSASAGSNAATRTSCPAASSSGWPWPGPWPSNPRSSCSTSRSRRSTPPCGPACAQEVAQILRGRGTTTVLVTHDQDEALSMAERVAVLRDGRIVANARPEDLYRSPLDAELAGFVGEANLLPGRVEGDVARTALGRLELQDQVSAGWPGPDPAAVVLVRPEQLEVRPPHRRAARPAGSSPGSSTAPSSATTPSCASCRRP